LTRSRQFRRFRKVGCQEVTRTNTRCHTLRTHVGDRELGRSGFRTVSRPITVECKNSFWLRMEADHFSTRIRCVHERERERERERACVCMCVTVGGCHATKVEKKLMLLAVLFLCFLSFACLECCVRSRVQCRTSRRGKYGSNGTEPTKVKREKLRAREGETKRNDHLRARASGPGSTHAYTHKIVQVQQSTSQKRIFIR
jgi:hypothetical protein